ncbi:MAG: sensor domain-containing diguanylate cyclase [Candidatus Thiodiazotropha sp. (ex Cardiolucina cf. quadrata)]|nr:sensor domain-containing diguanylate cyclase [Candidatus Thiodiazotropha sp. (ex Cardiolucina cf. quadrata)]
MNNHHWLLALLAFLLLVPFLETRAFEQPAPQSVILENGFSYADLTDKIQILIDPQQQLGFKSISSTRRQRDFRLNSGKIGFTDAAVWIRFSLESRFTTKQPVILEIDFPLIDKIEFYEMDGKGNYRLRFGGDSIPFNLREIKFRNTLFKIELEPGQTATYYMKFASRGPIQLPLRIWNYQTFTEHSTSSHLWHGLYFGAILLLIVASVVGYNLFRASFFLWYAYYLSCYGLLNFTLVGFAGQFLWPETPILQQYATSLLVNLVIIGAVVFSEKLLNIRKYSRTYFLVFRALIILALLGIAISLAGRLEIANRIASLSGMALVPILISAAIVTYRKGNFAARYFLVAWGVFLIFVFISGLYYWGMLPYGFVTAHALQIGSVFEVTMLGVAAADRVKLLSREKEEADRLANKYLVLLNEKLEDLVHERTVELEESNRKLHELATHDSLTLLLNHNAIIHALESAISAVERHRQPLSIAMVDIDRFKQINDRFGHQVGDDVLVAIANAFTSSLRGYDIIGRYGGEEFLLILPQTNTEDAGELIERLRQSIADLSFAGTQGKRVTISVGMIAYLHGIKIDADAMIRCADDALYRAKANGRDRIEWGNCTTILNKTGYAGSEDGQR